MEYEVYLGCNIIGAVVVVLIFAYHIIAAKPMKTPLDERHDTDVHLSRKTKVH